MSRGFLAGLLLLLLLPGLATDARALSAWGPGEPPGSYYKLHKAMAILWWGCSFAGNVQIVFKAYDDDGWAIQVELREYSQDPVAAGTFDGIPYNLLHQAEYIPTYDEAVIISLSQSLAADKYYALMIVSKPNGTPSLDEYYSIKITGEDTVPNLKMVRIWDSNGDGSWEPYDPGSYPDPVFQIMADQIDCSSLVELKVLSVEPQESGVRVKFYLDGLQLGTEFYAHIAADTNGDGVLDKVSRDAFLTFQGPGTYEIVVSELTYTPWHVRIVWTEWGTAYEKVSEPRTETYIKGWGGVRTLVNVIMTVAPLAVQGTLVFLPYAGVLWSLWLLSSIFRTVEETSVEPVVDFFYRNYRILMGLFGIAKAALEASASLAAKAVELIKTLIDIVF